MLYDVVERVGPITVNRPEARNALNGNVLTGMASTLDEVEADKGVGSIVVTGAGGKAFCAGADLAGSFTGDESFLDRHERGGDLARLLVKMNQCKKPILASVEGYCLLGGWVCACRATWP